MEGSTIRFRIAIGVSVLLCGLSLHVSTKVVDDTMRWAQVRAISDEPVEITPVHIPEPATTQTQEHAQIRVQEQATVALIAELPTQMMAATEQPTSAMLDVPVQQMTSFPQFMTLQEEDLQFADPNGSKCNIADPNLPSIYTATDFQMELPLRKLFGRVHGNWQISPTMRETNSKNSTATIACAIPQDSNLLHFPHALQHILKCWSLWQRFQGAQHVMIMRPQHHKFLVTSSSFNSGIAHMMELNNIVFHTNRSDPVRYKETYTSDLSRLFIAKSNGNMNSYNMLTKDDLQDFKHKVLASIPIRLDQTVQCSTLETTAATAAPTVSTSVHTRMNTSDPVSHEASHPSINNTIQLDEPRIAILNRRGSRRLLNSTAISLHLQHRLNLPYKPPVFYFETMSFAEQMEALTNVDILLSPHGAQLTGIFAMPQCGSLIEVFPHGYYRPKFFGSLASLSGLNHAYVYLGNDASEAITTMGSFQHRVRARAENLCAPIERIVEAVFTQLNQWRQCCRSTQAQQQQYGSTL